jgi:hypothetical protein
MSELQAPDVSLFAREQVSRHPSGKAFRHRDVDEATRASRSARGFVAWVLISFLASFGLVWIYVWTMPMAFLDRDYPVWIAKRAMLDTCRLGTVSVFGDSRTMAAVKPDAMPLPVTNFALSGTSPLETYFAVQRALRCPTPPKLVVIAHGALKFALDSDYWVFSARAGFLDYAEMRSVEAEAARLHDHELEDLRRGDEFGPAVRERLFALRYPPFYFDSLVNGFLFARWFNNRHAMAEALRTSGHMTFGAASGDSGVAGEGGSRAFQPSPLVDFYFDKTLALLAAHHVPVVFLSMPVNQATFDDMTPQLQQKFDAYLRTKADQFPGLRVVGPPIPCWPNRFYGDSWHFNETGATAFSRELGPWLQAVLADGPAQTLPNHCDTTENLANRG